MNYKKQINGRNVLIPEIQLKENKYENLNKPQCYRRIQGDLRPTKIQLYHIFSSNEEAENEA